MPNYLSNLTVSGIGASVLVMGPMNDSIVKLAYNERVLSGNYFALVVNIPCNFIFLCYLIFVHKISKS